MQITSITRSEFDAATDTLIRSVIPVVALLSLGCGVTINAPVLVAAYEARSVLSADPPQESPQVRLRGLQGVPIASSFEGAQGPV